MTHLRHRPCVAVEPPMTVCRLCSGTEDPVFYEFKFYVELGGLASYGPDISAYFRRGADSVENPATFLSNCLRRRPWPWLRPCRKSADPMPPSSPYDPWPAARRRPCRRRSGSCQRIHQVDDVAGIGFTAVRSGSRLHFLVQQLDECVFVAVFKFARFDRLHGRDTRSKPEFSVAVAAVAVAGVAVAAVAVAAV